MMLAASVVSVADTPNGGAKWNYCQPVSQVSKLRGGTYVAVVQKQCAYSRARNQQMCISGFDLLARVVKFGAVTRMEKRSSFIRQVASDDETRTTDAIELFRVLNKITRSRAPDPPVLYKVASFIFGRNEPVHQPGTDQIIPIKLHYVLWIPQRFRVVPSRA